MIENTSVGASKSNIIGENLRFLKGCDENLPKSRHSKLVKEISLAAMKP